MSFAGGMIMGLSRRVHIAQRAAMPGVKSRDTGSGGSQAVSSEAGNCGWPLGYPPRAYGWIFLLAVFPQLIGHSTYNWVLRHIPATRVAVITLPFIRRYTEADLHLPYVNSFSQRPRSVAWLSRTCSQNGHVHRGADGGSGWRNGTIGYHRRAYRQHGLHRR